MREQSDKFKSRDIHILLPGLSKTTKIMKNQKKKKIRELLQNKGNKKDKITKCKWKILDRGRGCKNIPGTIEGF